MILVTTEEVPGYQVKDAVGLVRGSTIRAKHVGKDILAGLRTIIGGEIKEYTEMLVEARNESLRRMEAQAEQIGADAVVNHGQRGGAAGLRHRGYAGAEAVSGVFC
jgi:uncharacterized protein YbjQ (UPF0145 family)